MSCVREASITLPLLLLRTRRHGSTTERSARNNDCMCVPASAVNEPVAALTSHRFAFRSPYLSFARYRCSPSVVSANRALSDRLMSVRMRLQPTCVHSVTARTPLAPLPLPPPTHSILVWHCSTLRSFCGRC